MESLLVWDGELDLIFLLYLLPVLWLWQITFLSKVEGFYKYKRVKHKDYKAVIIYI